jgi:hypothetical protein
MGERSIQLGAAGGSAGDEALFDAYRVFGVPGTVLIGADGRLARPPALGADAARETIASANGERLRARAEVAAG